MLHVLEVLIAEEAFVLVAVEVEWAELQRLRLVGVWPFPHRGFVVLHGQHHLIYMRCRVRLDFGCSRMVRRTCRNVRIE